MDLPLATPMDPRRRRAFQAAGELIDAASITHSLRHQATLLAPVINESRLCLDSSRARGGAVSPRGKNKLHERKYIYSAYVPIPTPLVDLINDYYRIK